MALKEIQAEIKDYLTGKSIQPEAFKLLSKEAQSELSVYKSLACSSINNLICSFFPLTFQVIAEISEELKADFTKGCKLNKQMPQLVIDFYESYPSTSAVLIDSCAQFVEFLADEKFINKYSFPAYLSELAKFEWSKTQIYYQENQESDTLLCPNFLIEEFAFPVSAIVQALKAEQNITEMVIEASAEVVCFYRKESNKQVQEFKLQPASFLALVDLSNGASLEELHTNIPQNPIFANIDAEILKGQLNKLIEEFKRIELLRA